MHIYNSYISGITTYIIQPIQPKVKLFINIFFAVTLAKAEIQGGLTLTINPSPEIGRGRLGFLLPLEVGGLEIKGWFAASFIHYDEWGWVLQFRNTPE